MEIKIQLNDSDHIVVDDIYNGGIRFRMFGNDCFGKPHVFHNSSTQRMLISKNRIDSVIKSLQDIKKMMED